MILSTLLTLGILNCAIQMLDFLFHFHMLIGLLTM